MKTPIVFGCVAFSACVAHAGSQPTEAAPPKPLRATYSIYSGEFGDAWAPTPNDRKLSINVTGQSAKDIFDALGPDLKSPGCEAEKGERQRRKGDVWCFYAPSEGYQCFLGFEPENGQEHRRWRVLIMRG